MCLIAWALQWPGLRGRRGRVAKKEKKNQKGGKIVPDSMVAAVSLGFEGGEEGRHEFHAVIPVTHTKNKSVSKYICYAADMM